MKKIYFTILISCMAFATAMAQGTATDPNGKVTIQAISAEGLCDGSAMFNPGSITEWEWFQDSTFIQTGGDMIDSLCEGNYSVMYSDSAGTSVTDNFYIGFEDTTSTGGTDPNANGRVFPMMVSAAGVCDGAADFDSNGLTTWKWFLHDSTEIQIDGNSISQLCEGDYFVEYSDSTGASMAENFFIGVEGDTTGTDPGPDPTTDRIIAVYPVSDNGVCDGGAEFDSDGLTTWKWFKDSTEIQIDGNSISQLCEGDYSVEYGDSAGTNMLVNHFFVGSDGDSTGTDPGTDPNSNGGKVTFIGVSASGNCDGGAAFDAGSITSWEWFQDSSSIQVGGDTINSLCEGDYSVQYQDSAGTNMIVENFFIGIEGDSTGTDPGPDPNPNGRVTFHPVTDQGACDGSADFESTGVATWKWFNDSTEIQIDGNSISQLCEGDYSVEYPDSLPTSSHKQSSKYDC